MSGGAATVAFAHEDTFADTLVDSDGKRSLSCA